MSVFQSPILWVVVVVIAVTAIFLFIKNRNPSARGAGFVDYLKEPEDPEDSVESQEREEAAVKAAQDWDDGKVASMTRRFVLEATSTHEVSDQIGLLRSLGEKTHPAVLNLLRDASLYDRLVKPDGKAMMAESPFNRACTLLGNAPGVESVDALAPFLSDPSPEIRRAASFAIAKTGSVTIAPLVRKAFSDPDEYVRSYAVMGLGFAMDRSGLADAVRLELFPDVMNLLRADQDDDDAFDLLYRFDSTQATDYFLSPEVFTVESPILHEVLEVLAKRKVPVPRDSLQSLISGLEMGKLNHPNNYSLGEALRLLGQLQREEDRDFLQSRLTHPDERVAKGAAEGLLRSLGLEGLTERIWDAEKQSGHESLPENQRLYRAVFLCDDEINNGGLAQFFANSSGDLWRDALAGFKAMGFEERLAVLTEAIAIFGSNGPSANQRVRKDQLSRLMRRDDELFDALDSRYYKSPEVIEVFACRFVLGHPEAFR